MYNIFNTFKIKKVYENEELKQLLIYSNYFKDTQDSYKLIMTLNYQSDKLFFEYSFFELVNYLPEEIDDNLYRLFNLFYQNIGSIIHNNDFIEIIPNSFNLIYIESNKETNEEEHYFLYINEKKKILMLEEKYNIKRFRFHITFPRRFSSYGDNKDIYYNQLFVGYHHKIYLVGKKIYSSESIFNNFLTTLGKINMKKFVNLFLNKENINIRERELEIPDLTKSDNIISDLSYILLNNYNNIQSRLNLINQNHYHHCLNGLASNIADLIITIIAMGEFIYFSPEKNNIKNYHLNIGAKASLHSSKNRYFYLSNNKIKINHRDIYKNIIKYSLFFLEQINCSILKKLIKLLPSLDNYVFKYACKDLEEEKEGYLYYLTKLGEKKIFINIFETENNRNILTDIIKDKLLKQEFINQLFDIFNQSIEINFINQLSKYNNNNNNNNNNNQNIEI